MPVVSMFLHRGRQRIATLILIVLMSIAAIVLVGLVLTTARLVGLRAELRELRDSALPRLVKLAQLSQEASATSAIAPALSARPARSELETLLSRIHDKESSQHDIVAELRHLSPDAASAEVLQRNGDLLVANLRALAEAVREQGVLDERIQRRSAQLRAFLQDLSDAEPGESGEAAIAARRIVIGALDMFLDSSRPRVLQKWTELEQALPDDGEDLNTGAATAVQRFIQYWLSQKEEMHDEKISALANDFQISALVEENALLSNRLLNTANEAFWIARTEIENQIRSVSRIVAFSLMSIIGVLLAFALGNFSVWRLLRHKIFLRLDRLRDGLREFADSRKRPLVDPRSDEIGEISGALDHYMGVIDEREVALADKTKELEQLAKQLAKYLSPQVYDSIFAGKREVKLASSRKKLTIFFSDIVEFTEAADRLESEELTSLLNEYLTEMSSIAIEFGATIDKYIGDAILIFFGDPESRGTEQDAISCVNMAIAMRHRMNVLQDRWRESGIEKPLRVRMGIHTGYCTVGNFGSEDRMDYTIVGSAVNVASRLQEIASPGEIILSYETFALTNDRIYCEGLGELQVKGLGYPIAAYRVIDNYENLNKDERRIHWRSQHFRLDADLLEMEAEERRRVTEMLHDTLNQVRGDDQA